MFKWNLSEGQYEACCSYIDRQVCPKLSIGGWSDRLTQLETKLSEVNDPAAWAAHLLAAGPYLVSRALRPYPKLVYVRLDMPVFVSLAVFRISCLDLLRRGYPPPGVLGYPDNHPLRVLMREWNEEVAGLSAADILLLKIVFPIAFRLMT